MNSDKKTRRFLVISEKGGHEYTIVVSEVNQYGRKYELFSSDNETWTPPYRNKVLLTMTDTGNGVEFDNAIKFAEYDMAMYMRLLLNFDSKFFASVENTFKIIEEDSIIEL